MLKDKMTDHNTVYEEVVRVTRVYLGPAAERFIKRQAENHLHKSAERLTKADLTSLIDWIKVVVSLITDDERLVDEYITELSKITHQEGKRRG